MNSQNWVNKNKKHLREYAKQWRKDNPNYQKNYDLKRHYGITLQQFNDMLLDQNNCCAICKKPETSIHTKYSKTFGLSVDHNKITGKVRQLLCFHCNSALGKANEDINILKEMINYLEKHK
jgi:Recombination endonuclease VII